jgi:hypothetical protein
MIIRPPPAAHLRPGNASNGEETSLSNSIINETEAALVGHTFRNALRVNYENEQQENRRKSMASNSDLNDSNKQLTITEHDFLPPDLADELVNSCSPVLSQLAAVVEK